MFCWCGHPRGRVGLSPVSAQARIRPRGEARSSIGRGKPDPIENVIPDHETWNEPTHVEPGNVQPALSNSPPRREYNRTSLLYTYRNFECFQEPRQAKSYPGGFSYRHASPIQLRIAPEPDTKPKINRLGCKKVTKETMRTTGCRQTTGHPAFITDTSK